MGLSKKENENLRLAAILHDVGKIGVRDNILLKEDRLDPEELEKMNMHPQYGSDILSHVKKLRDIIPGVRGHHERIDGKGYPDNLRDGDIPIIARIIAVADTFDAMTTDRPYRKAMSSEAAFEELRKNSGIQFDKDVVEAFIRVYKEMEFVP
jgi:HD-GYP domain-containing protein (c-di-GMP phosphodiesterase class II)